jgi:hypothetical protein
MKQPTSTTDRIWDRRRERRSCIRCCCFTCPTGVARSFNRPNRRHNHLVVDRDISGRISYHSRKHPGKTGHVLAQDGVSIYGKTTITAEVDKQRRSLRTLLCRDCQGDNLMLVVWLPAPDAKATLKRLGARYPVHQLKRGDRYGSTVHHANGDSDRRWRSRKRKSLR